MAFMKLFGTAPRIAIGPRSPCIFLVFVGMVAVVLGRPEGVLAQVVCQAEVGYEVKRVDLENPEVVVVRREEARGEVEEVVRQALSRKLVLSSREALDACREQHENLSGCVASKYASLGTLLQQMQFAARTKLQDAIESDCKSRMGTCAPGKAPEITCIVPTPAVDPEAEASAAAEKEAGKKSGKK